MRGRRRRLDTTPLPPAYSDDSRRRIGGQIGSVSHYRTATEEARRPRKRAELAGGMERVRALMAAANRVVRCTPAGSKRDLLPRGFFFKAPERALISFNYRLMNRELSIDATLSKRSSGIRSFSRRDSTEDLNVLSFSHLKAVGLAESAKNSRSSLLRSSDRP